MSDDSKALAKAMKMVDNTKVTRAEIIDIIQEEVEADLVAEMHKAKDELHEHTNKRFTFDEVKDFLKNQQFCLNVQHYYKGEKPRVGLELLNAYGNVSESSDPSLFDAHVKRHLELKAQVDATSVQYQKFVSNKRSTKVAIIKKCLGASEEGRTLLEQLETFKKNIRVQLIK